MKKLALCFIIPVVLLLGGCVTPVGGYYGEYYYSGNPYYGWDDGYYGYSRYRYRYDRPYRYGRPYYGRPYYGGPVGINPVPKERGPIVGMPQPQMKQRMPVNGMNRPMMPRTRAVPGRAVRPGGLGPVNKVRTW
ncbi:hypothetical protein WJT86_09480 [Microvirga sp. W0021]|uniref:Lipoprotein n=1 Tax=Hohaiivirga grylli TaxID=3133970 RepID=A0ABV0BJX2_9HYPH